ncbi:MAG: GNAT family N-acetyltransferase [Verrucomicrobiae bacterium]|nr:GNAT family N-acetyltransferase [Verrucomicrobiae bacterium]
MKDIEIRKMTEADLPEAMALKEVEGWNQTEDDWRFYLEHNPEHCLVASRGGQVLGTVTAANYCSRVAWIGMMLVNRSARRQGISSCLMREVIESLKDCDSIKLDATPAGRQVYRSLGFLDEFEIVRMGSQNTPPGLPESLKAGVISRIQESDISEIFALDSQAIGVDRPELIRYLLSNHPGENLCVRRDGKIYGFALLRKGTRFNHVGPVVCRHSEDALAMILELRKIREGAMIVDLLADKTFLHEKLLEAGFIIQRSFTRMYLERNPRPGEPVILQAITGPELG